MYEKLQKVKTIYLEEPHLEVDCFLISSKPRLRFFINYGSEVNGSVNPSMTLRGLELLTFEEQIQGQTN